MGILFSLVEDRDLSGTLKDKYMLEGKYENSF